MDSESNDVLEHSANHHQSVRRGGWRMGMILAWVGLAALLGLLFLGLLESQKGRIKVGEPVPDFTLVTFDGQEYRLSNLRGKAVLVNIWASWCKPCEQEASDLEAAWRFYQPRGDVVFLGVAWTDTDRKSVDYLEKYGISYPNGPDLSTRIYDAFGATGVPETYIIDRYGILAYVKISPFLSLDEIKQALDAVLER